MNSGGFRSLPMADSIDKKKPLILRKGAFLLDQKPACYSVAGFFLVFPIRYMNGPEQA